MDTHIIATEHAIQEAARHHELRNIPKINTPFGYFGSKNKIALQLMTHMPPHNCWVEAFCGSAALTLVKRKAPIEVINDIDGEIVNVFTQLRNNAEEICRLISLTPYAREEFEEARKAESSDTGLERARKFLVQAMMAVNGAFGKEKGGFSYSQSYSRNGRDARVNRWYNLPERLTEVVERLRDVRIENRDAIELVKMFETRPATLMYLDPPYLGERAKAYTNDALDHKFHEELLKAALSSKCMVFISGYDNELYNSMLTPQKNWSKTIIDTITKDIKGNGLERKEVVWTNKNFQQALTTGKLPLRLSKIEKKENKLNPERKK